MLDADAHGVQEEQVAAWELGAVFCTLRCVVLCSVLRCCHDHRRRESFVQQHGGLNWGWKFHPFIRGSRRGCFDLVNPHQSQQS